MKRSKLIGLSIVTLFFLTGSRAHAQQESGDNEIQFSVSTSVPIKKASGDTTGTTATTGTMGNIQTNLGHFFSRRLEAGAGMFLSISSGNTTVSPTGFIRFYLATGRTAPYLDTGVFVVSSAGTHTAMARLGGGIKQFLSRRTAVDLNIFYRADTKNFGNGNVETTAGIAFIF